MRAALVEMRLPELDPAENVQLRELASTALDALELALDVQQRWGQHPVLVDPGDGNSPATHPRE